MSAEVRTGAEQAAQDGEGVGEFVTFIRYFLLGFGGIALFVGAFVIFNTLSITVAQRTKELATLRTLGASRRQVLRSVVLEGTVLGARRLGGRPRARRAAGEGADRALPRGRPRDAAGGDGLPAADCGRRDADRHARDARRLGLAGGARDPDRTDRGRARRRHGRQAAVPPDARLRARRHRPLGLRTRVRLARRGRLGRRARARDRPRRVRRSSSAWPRSHRGSSVRSPTSSASPPPGSAARPGGSRRRTRCATRAGRPRPRRR